MKKQLESKLQLREYQLNIVSKVLSDTKSKDLIQLPTGGGKTIIAGFLCAEYLKRNKKVLFLAHREELLYQPKEKFLNDFGIEAGIIKAQLKQDLDLDVQIASVQTFHRRLNFCADVIIIDEAHHVEAATYQTIINEYPRAKLIGLTATPYRLSGKGFTQTFNKLITEKTVKQLEQESFLVPARCFNYPLSHDKLARITITGGDYNEKEISDMMNERVIIEDILESYTTHAIGKKMVVFAASVRNSEAIRDNFNAHGISALHVDANSSNREDIIKEFRYGKTNILCNVGIATEGFDMSEIQVVCMARPTYSLARYLQMCGRASRPSANKTHYLLLDHTNNFFEHGEPSKQHDWNAYFNGMSKRELKELSENKRFSVRKDGKEIEVDNILELPADIKGFALEEIASTHSAYFEINDEDISPELMELIETEAKREGTTKELYLEKKIKSFYGK